MATFSDSTFSHFTVSQIKYVEPYGVCTSHLPLHSEGENTFKSLCSPVSLKGSEL